MKDDVLRQLEAAIDALHAVNFVHGRIDASHVYVDAAGMVTLAFSPDAPGDASKESDLASAAALAQ